MRMRYTIATTAAVISIAAAWYWFREDPALAAARATQAQLAALGENASEAERRALWEQMRGQMQTLTDEQRRALFRDRQGGFENRMRAAVDGFFALPENQRQAYLDQQIRQMEQRRLEMQRRFAQRPPGNNGRSDGGPPRGDRPGAGPRNGGPGAGGPGGGGPGGGGGRERQMLDNTSPVDRAKNAAYFTALEKRRKELGLPEMGIGRR